MLDLYERSISIAVLNVNVCIKQQQLVNNVELSLYYITEPTHSFFQKNDNYNNDAVLYLALPWFSAQPHRHRQNSCSSITRKVHYYCCEIV